MPGGHDPHHAHDRALNAVEVNDRARRLLRRGQGLSDREGVLRARQPADRPRLERLVAGALPTAGAVPVSGSMLLARAAGAPPFVAHVKPVAVPQPDYGARYVAALVLIVEPRSQRRIDPDLVARTLGLTPMESRIAVGLAHLVGGERGGPRVSPEIGREMGDAAPGAGPRAGARTASATEHGAKVVVPPAKTARLSRRRPRSSARDRTIRTVTNMSRRRWKKEAGYHRQARVENAFFRYKSILGDRLRGRTRAAQELESVLACNVLNRMTELGRPVPRT